MSYSLRVLLDKPDGFWEGTTDLSGRANNATPSGSPADYANLVAGAGGSKIITSTAEITYPNRVFTEDRGIKPFTLEAWVKPLMNANPASILGQDDASGLVLEENVVKFIVPFNNESVETSFTFVSPEVYHVVGTFDGFGIALYVNGQLVDTADVDIEHRDAGLNLSSDDLLAGTTAATGDLFILDSPAIYGYALTGNQIADHFKWGRNIQNVRDVISQRDGLYHRFIDDDAGLYARRTFNTAADWGQAYSVDVNISDDGVVPAEDDAATSLAGVIEVSAPLLTDDVIYGARIDWVGSGDFTVETSVDHTTYSPAVNHGIIADSYINPIVDESIFVRITFDGSIVDDPSVVESLSVVVYSSDTVVSDRNSREAVLDEGVTLGSEENQPIEFNDWFGARIDGTSLVINPDEQVAVSEDPDGLGEGIEPPDEINAIELWVKFNLLSGAFYLIDTRDSTNTSYPRMNWTGSAMAQTNFTRVYINGEYVPTIGSYTFQTGVWYHIVMTYSAAFNPTITLGREYNGANDADTDFQLGHLATYTDFPIFGTTPDPTGQDLLSAYLGIPAEVSDGDSTIGIAEDDIRIYSYDWAINPAG